MARWYVDCRLYAIPYIFHDCLTGTGVDIAKELHIHDQMAILSKETLKHRILKEIETKILEEIDNEAETKTKIYHWKERKKEIKVGTRPTYMDKLNRKQCNAILRARSSMLMVKENYKKTVWEQPTMQVLWQLQWNPRTYPTGLHQNKKIERKDHIQQNIRRRHRTAKRNSKWNHQNRRMPKRASAT